MKRLLVAMLLATVTAVLSCGCRTVPEDENAVDQLPWNTPAGWEGQVIGVPY
ncbi:MAG: hypothetical protein HN742_22600 [Lentisphaerae bacterium]|jgi:hypothetical protein|nr:hypothetical protein [Lentisphaerota bacterium]MBT4819231.1 hypothetical protein [Lentisphaerota bacterium]MBT5605026.1 hypothetical protein [Lentisphaerota bacterium]MBT7054656.1 hypothetical protein [Lentisphaerota bacterium]MBT7844685.1 hypothetical protein [Lentisphaerota bacterium]